MSEATSDLGEDLGRARTLREAGALREAESLCRKLLAERPNDPAALLELGAILARGGDLAGAQARFLEAMSAPGAAVSAGLGLGKLALARGESATALEHFQDALSLEPDNPEVHGLLGAFHQRAGNLTDAAAHYRRVLETAPESLEIRPVLAQTLLQLGQPDECLSVLAPLLAVKVENPALDLLAAEALLRLGEPARAVDHLERVLAFPKLRTRALSLLSIGLVQQGWKAEEDALVSLDGLVVAQDALSTLPEGDAADLNRALVEFVASHPTLREVPSTKGGRDTKLILDAPEPFVRLLRGLIETRIDEVIAGLERTPGHPFARARPPAFELEGWGVVMGPSGYQIPHAHPKAWLSGVYYVQVPKEIDLGPDSHLGWIEFGQGPEELYAGASPRKRLVRPRAGSLISFPSYVWHRTFPSTSETPRISIAFDVVPKTG